MKKPKEKDSKKNATPAAPEKIEKPISQQDWDRLLQEKEDLFARLQRATADYQNLRKRIEKDISTRVEDRLLDIISQLLPVMDHFELALKDQSADTNSAFYHGIQLIFTSLQDILVRQGIQPIDTQNAIFDPKIHEGVLQEETADVPAGTILEELRRGYRWAERVIRPAQVKIAIEKKKVMDEEAEENGNANV